MIKPRLILLSDLFGGNPEWIQYYVEILEPKFDVQFYDVLKLAQIDSSNDEKEIHNQFLSRGIEKAVANLLNYEKGDIAILGFSIGGTIAWKASLRGLKTIQLVAVSSTRLRFETEVPNCEMQLYFGSNDFNKPNQQWFSNLKMTSQIFENEDHWLYSKKNNILLICSNFL